MKTSNISLAGQGLGRTYVQEPFETEFDEITEINSELLVGASLCTLTNN